MNTDQQELLDAIRAGDHQQVRLLVPQMDDAAREKCLPAIKQVVREVPRGVHTPVFGAAELAGWGCQPTPAAAAQWIAAMSRRRPGRYSGSSADVLAGRDSGWLGELANRLAAEMDKEGGFEGTHPFYELVQNLIRMSGCATPTTAGYAVTRVRYSRGLADLRADPDMPVLLPVALDVDGFGARILKDDQWLSDLVDLAESGHLDRAALIDQCAGRLLRGGRPSEMRGFRRLLDRLELTEDEIADRAGDWARLAVDADAQVASDALIRLRLLTDAGRLDLTLLADTARDVLARPEKALVSAQLKLLDRALRHDRYDAAQLLVAATVAFGHEENAVQDQAWKLVARHLRTVDQAVRSQIAEAVAVLTPDLRRRATDELGGPAPTAEPVPARYQETLPPVAVPEPAASALESLPELVREVSAILAARSPSTTESERALDALVRFAHQDRAALTDALSTIAYVREDQTYEAGIGVVVLVLVGKVDDGKRPLAPTEVDTPVRARQCAHCAFRLVWRARLLEVARRITTDPPPFLLATPTWHTGAVDADVLLERLTEYAQRGFSAGPADLDQALLRTRLPEEPERQRLVAAAASLGTADGTRFAAWLSTGGLRPVAEESFGSALPALRSGFTEPFRRVSGRMSWVHFHDQREVRDLPGRWGYLELVGRSIDLPQWVATVPVSREYVAEQMLTSGACEHLDKYAGDLHRLVAADGPAGPALHRLVADALVRASPQNWAGVIDGLLQLVARNEFDAAQCGEYLGRWQQGDNSRPPEVLDVLSEVARTGAYATVWGIVAGALPGLLPEGRRPRRLAALLSLAADCVSQCGATGTLPELDSIADSKASSQTVKQARRLRQCLTAAASSRMPS
ncbi:DUF6493 family protein [Micromonospora parva]|uniref:DUF7824 domain-containing protein n=1 Tax=Micromonospora parva TaxID=1464048 RepID=UPI0033F8A024